ncbi:iron-containing alcohol dehydrogenase [Salicibibacter kimchii]|uniref:Iron-containing alcohol dehydrogenase n=1 Tax=Salicibibacter kimchii TaxID=2099786 RepID=A0A345C1E2_9BACI|nr:iron-containing alcohol dehydrogenase [Salicibibacter kimchii]AXF57023.1 iron-containing alcohol dehydrogenase [Salicibibacter kimchii]
MEFQYGIPSQATFGHGVVKKVGEVLSELEATKVLFVCDEGVKKAGIVDKVQTYMEEKNVAIVPYSNVVPNPPETVLDEGADLAKKEQVEAVVAVGGGSSIDTAKALNILITNPTPINQYDGINNIKNPTKPLIAIPTTSGTGSEVTSITVITDTKQKKKMVIGGRHCGADIALVDPELTMGLPPTITAATGMDALTHGIESYVSNFASVPSDVNGLKAIELISNNIVEAYQNGNNVEARTNMLLGSMLAGYAFNSALLGLVHAIAHPLSVYCGLPHGVANASTLSYAMAFNARDENVQKLYRDIGRSMGVQVDGLSDVDAAYKTLEAIKSLSDQVQIPTLSEAGVKREQFDVLAEATLNEEISIMANPTKVTKEDVLEILDLAYLGSDIQDIKYLQSTVK